MSNKICKKYKIWRSSQAVRRGSATPWSPVQIRSVPLKSLGIYKFRGFYQCAKHMKKWSGGPFLSCHAYKKRSGESVWVYHIGITQNFLYDKLSSWNDILHRVFAVTLRTDEAVSRIVLFYTADTAWGGPARSFYLRCFLNERKYQSLLCRDRSPCRFHRIRQIPFRS